MDRTQTESLRMSSPSITDDDLRQIERTARERCETTVEQARRERGVWGWVLREWVVWDGSGPREDGER